MDAFEEIKQTVSLVDEMEKHQLSLTRSGPDRMKCICPFHADSDPSLTVYLQNEEGYESFNCFGCNAGGTVIDYIMLAEEVNKSGALRYFSKNYNLNLSKDINFSELLKAKPYVKSSRVDLRSNLHAFSVRVFGFLRHSEEPVKNLMAIKPFLKEIDDAVSRNDEYYYYAMKRVVSEVMLNIIKKTGLGVEKV